jgi:hypothetical protein
VEKIMSCYLVEGEDKMRIISLKKMSEEELMAQASKSGKIYLVLRPSLEYLKTKLSE